MTIYVRAKFHVNCISEKGFSMGGSFTITPCPIEIKDTTLQSPESLPKIGLKGVVQTQRSDNYQPSQYYWFDEGGIMKILIALDV